MKKIHRWTFQGVDTSHIKTTKDNGYVWVMIKGRQVRMKRVMAIQEGQTIISKKRENAAQGAEVHDGISTN